MSDFVTYETAVKLREAGFPQPKITAHLMGRQFWYTPQKRLVATTHGYLASTWIIFLESPMDEPQMTSGAHDLVFAATATDILRELPYMAIAFNDGVFYTSDEYVEGDGVRCEEGENAAEVAAITYLNAKNGVRF